MKTRTWKYGLAAVLLVGAVPALAYWSFGSKGSDGRDGSNGPNGISGRDITVRANGSFQSYDLSGTDAGNGSNGSNGSDAYGCASAFQPAYNLVGADGGRGGDAGDGGVGGSGGDVTVFYSNPSDIRQIQVFSRPGRGGFPGAAAYGGDGCRCYQSMWQHTSCSTDNQGHQHCTTQTYTCRDGVRGRPGYAGTIGSNGTYGSIFLVRGDSIPAQNTETSLTLGQIGNGPFLLSRNRWISRSGATALFAQGSNIRDDYTEFDRNIQARYAIRWAAPRPIEEFASSRIHLSMGSDFVIRPTLSDSLWVQSHEETANGVTTLVITNVVTEEEAGRMEFVGIKGIGTELEIELRDLANVSDLVKSSFSVKIGNKTIFWYTTRYEGPVADSLVRREGDRFFLRVGQIVKKAKQHLREGRNLRISVRAVRAFSGYTQNWSVENRKVEVEDAPEEDRGSDYEGDASLAQAK